MKLLARRRIVHDGRAYGPGDPIEVSGNAAQALLAAGAAQAAPEQPARPRRRRER